MVDEAKAFCPNCGHAFVDEEKRQDSSEFDRMDGTMQFSKTVYGQMLSDMGLNLADLSAIPPEPLPPAAEPASQPQAAQVIRPPVQQVVRPPVQQVINPVAKPAPPSGSSRNKWLIIGGVALLLVILLIAAILIILVLLLRFG